MDTPAASHPPKKASRFAYLLGIALLLVFAVATFLLRTASPTSGIAADEARSEERRKALAELQAENTKRLTTYAWADQSAGTVQIPLDRAIELTIPALNAKPPMVPPATPAEALPSPTP